MPPGTLESDTAETLGPYHAWTYDLEMHGFNCDRAGVGLVELPVFEHFADPDKSISSRWPLNLGGLNLVGTLPNKVKHELAHPARDG